jgi:hypothetical protein
VNHFTTAIEWNDRRNVIDFSAYRYKRNHERMLAEMARALLFQNEQWGIVRTMMERGEFEK